MFQNNGPSKVSTNIYGHIPGTQQTWTINTANNRTRNLSSSTTCFGFDTNLGYINSYKETCPKTVVIPSQIQGVEVT